MKYATLVALLATTASAEVEICFSVDECPAEGACCGWAYDVEVIEQICSDGDGATPDLTELVEEGYSDVQFSCDKPASEEGASRLAVVSAAALSLLYLA